jgi:flavin-dependent dehydrogenase
MDVLDEVGVGEDVRQVAPASHSIRLNKNGATVDLQYADGRAEYCPRRKRLDDLLQKAAVAAGAELLERTRVTELVWKGDRVAGVRAVREGKEHVFTARVVVGADGRHSTVAKMLEAEEYLGYDAPRAMYWGYWDAPDFWRTDPAYRFGLYIGHIADDIRVIFPTDRDQLLIGSLPPADQTETWRADPRATLVANLAKDPVTAPLIENTEPDGNIRGTVKERYFFRRGAGPGWVLVGDAGHHKEFVIGDGITEALIQARSLAAAVLTGTDEALARWWRARDVEALPLYFFGQDEGALGPPAELQRVVFSYIAGKPALRARMARTMEHQVSPYEVLPVSTVLRCLLGAALRGRLRVVPEFLVMGKRGSTVRRELTARRKLLADMGG